MTVKQIISKKTFSIITDPDYSFFIPTKQLGKKEVGDITLHIDELETREDSHRLNISKNGRADGLSSTLSTDDRKRDNEVAETLVVEHKQII